MHAQPQSWRLPVILTVLLMAAVAHADPGSGSQPTRDTKSDTVRVYVVNHGWHTGFIVPATDIYKVLPGLHRRFGDVRWLELGWGDEGFYTAKTISGGLTLKALLWPTDTVLHVVVVPRHPRAYFRHSRVIALDLTPAAYARLVRHITGSFARQTGRLHTLQAGIYGNSQFYRARGRYHLLNTCNSWTAIGLQRIGFPIRTRFKLTANSISAYLRYRRHTALLTAP